MSGRLDLEYAPLSFRGEAVVEFSIFLLPCFREGLAPSLAAFYEELIETTQLADRTGWERVWVSEHHFHYYGGASPNPAMALLALARETERIRLAAGVSLLPLHHPLRVAEEFAMLDQLSGGRLDFGVGRGYLPHEFAGFRRDPAQATARFLEAFEIVTQAWRGEPFEHHGSFYDIDRLQLPLRPMQQPPPIYMACSRTRESFEFAGAHGLRLMSNHYPQSLRDLTERLDWYKRAYAAGGHDPAQRQGMISLFLHIAPSEEQAIAEAMPAVQEHANLFRLLMSNDVWNRDYLGDASVFEFIAPGGDVVDAFRERTAVGTAEQVCERVQRYHELGYTEVSFIVRYGGLSHAQCLANIEAVNRLVRPRFQSAA